MKQTGIRFFIFLQWIFVVYVEVDFVLLQYVLYLVVTGKRVVNWLL